MLRSTPAIRRALACSVIVVALAGCQSRPPAPSEPTPSSFGPSSAVALIEEALGLMDQYGLFASGPAWKTARAQALERSADASDAIDARRIIEIALLVAGGTHSRLTSPTDAPASLDSQPIPTVDPLDGGVVSLTLPAFSGADESQIEEYVTSAWDSIQTLSSEARCGWIVDVRGNSGGNVWPMLGAISPLLDRGLVMSFSDRDNHHDSVSITADGISLGATQTIAFDSASFEEASQSVSSRRIVVLIGPITSSSGEAIPVAFAGQQDTATLGKPTSGFSTANREFTLSDGSSLNLTSAVFADRTGRLYGGPIIPLEPNDQGASVVTHAAERLIGLC